MDEGGRGNIPPHTPQGGGVIGGVFRLRGGRGLAPPGTFNVFDIFINDIPYANQAYTHCSGDGDRISNPVYPPARIPFNEETTQ